MLIHQMRVLKKLGRVNCVLVQCGVIILSWFFENPYGDRVKIDGYYWSWGDYFEIEIGNYLNFSDWLSKQDVDWNMLNEDGYEYLADLVYWYREETDNE